MPLSIEQEEQKYWEEVEAVKQWWKDSRWRYTKRPFTAEQIVAKRGNLKIDYPSNVQSKKLWKLVEEKFKVRYKQKILKKTPADGQLNSDKHCQLHLWLSRSHYGHPDGQVP